MHVATGYRWDFIEENQSPKWDIQYIDLKTTKMKKHDRQKEKMAAIQFEQIHCKTTQLFNYPKLMTARTKHLNIKISFEAFSQTSDVHNQT